MDFPQLDKPDPEEEIAFWPLLYDSGDTIAEERILPMFSGTPLKTIIEYSVTAPDSEEPLDADKLREAMYQFGKAYERRLEGEAIRPSFVIRTRLKFEVPPDVIDQLNRSIMDQLLMRWSMRRSGYPPYDKITMPPIS